MLQLIKYLMASLSCAGKNVDKFAETQAKTSDVETQNNN